MAYTMTHLPQDSTTNAQGHPPTDSASGHLTSIELDTLLQPRQSARRRFVQAGSIILAVLLVVVFFIYPHWAGGFGHDATLPSQSTTPDVPIVLLSNVTYGLLTVNGKRLNDSPPAIAYLHAGKNTIDLKTPPFLPQHCDITWPEQQVTGSICQINRDPQVITVRGRSVQPIFLVEIRLTAAQLPPDARDSALHLVGDALTGLSETSARLVPAGQYFATGNLPESKVQLHQLPETIVAKPVTGAPLTPPFGSALDGSSLDCANLGCASSLRPPDITLIQQALGSSNVWEVGSDVSLRLDFSTTEGASRGSIVLSEREGVTLFLTYSPDGGWNTIMGSAVGDKGFPTLASRLDLSLCDAGSTWMQHLAQPALSANTSSSMEMFTGHGLQGCELQLDMQQGNGTQAARFLWRFGALLSENATAHQLVPSIPMAPSDEIAALTS